MKVTIEVSAHNGQSFPDRHYRAVVRIDAREEQRGSNVITRGLTEAAGVAALKLVEAAKR